MPVVWRKSGLRFQNLSAGCFLNDKALFFFNHSFQNGMDASGQLQERTPRSQGGFKHLQRAAEHRVTILFIKFIVIENNFIMMKFQAKLLSAATIKNLIRVGFYIFDNFEMLINYFPVIKIAF